MKRANEKSIEELLIAAGLITDEKLQEIKNIEEETGEKVEKILLSEGIINYKEILNLTAKRMGVEFVDLESIKVDKNAVMKLGAETARKYFVFPFEIAHNLLFLAMQNPDDIFLIDEIKMYTQMEIKPFLADGRLISKAINYFYGEETKSEVASAAEAAAVKIEKAEDSGNVIILKSQDGILSDSTNNADEFIRNILTRAQKNCATDIHICNGGGKGTKVRFRIDGILGDEINNELIAPETVISKIKEISGLNPEEDGKPQKGQIVYEISKKKKIYIEVLTLPVIEGGKLLMKLESPHQTFSLANIGLSEHEKNLIDSIITRRAGLLVVTGARGSGRTTTCYALLKELALCNLNIISLEKKIKEKLEGVNQIQLPGFQTDYVYNYIKAATEHDADVIMVDTDIDEKALRLLIETGLGGKLVIAPMLFPNAYEVIAGLIGMGIEPYKVAGAVSGIIAQYPVRKLCPKCKGRINTGEKAEAKLKEESLNANKVCNTCSGTGYKGKIEVFEIFGMNKEHKRLLIKDCSLEALKLRMGSEKSTFKANSIRLVNDEITSIEEVIKMGIGSELIEL